MKKIIFYILLILISINHTNAQIRFGINGHPLYSKDYSKISFDKQMKLLKKSNFLYYRIEVWYNSDYEITNGNGNESFDKLYKIAKEYNIELIPNIQFPEFTFDISPEKAYQIARIRGKKFALKNSKYFKLIEIGNENNLKIRTNNKKINGKYPYDSQKEKVLISYFKGFEDGIKDSKVGWKIIISSADDDDYFFSLLKKNNVYLDYIGSTKYGYDDDYEKTLKKYYSIYKKPIWILEFNYPSGSLNVSKVNQKYWLNDKINRIKKIKFVKALFFYELIDEEDRFLKDGPIFSKDEANYGLFRIIDNKIEDKINLDK